MNPTLSKEQILAALNERHSPQKQALLSSAHVAVAGLGGLGSNVAYALARIGVGHLHLIDFDVVDITNLNRQQYFIRHIGMYKTDALKSLLLDINPYLDIRTDCVKVTEENLETLFQNDPIVCEAFDRPEAKAMLVNGFRHRHGWIRKQQHHHYQTIDEKFLSVRRPCYGAYLRNA